MDFSGIICQGDLIDLFVDDIGHFAIPSSTEPLPERNDSVTHMRAIPHLENRAIPDFNTRCVFQITGDKGQCKGVPITYGSYVRLVNVATKQIVVGSSSEDTFSSSSGYSCVFLRSVIAPYEQMASQWEVVSRYKLRSEGGYLQDKDYLILRNMEFKTKFLTSVELSSDDKKFDHLIGMDATAKDKLGWRISCLSKYSMKPTTGGEEKLNIGAFIRLTHQEVQGHLITRLDDSKELCSRISPYGQIWHKMIQPPTSTHGVYVRNASCVTQPKSALSVWQILSKNTFDIHEVHSGDAIQLRHVASGQLLCIRQPTINDTNVILKESITYDKAQKTSKQTLESFMIDPVNVDDSKDQPRTAPTVVIPHPQQEAAEKATVQKKTFSSMFGMISTHPNDSPKDATLDKSDKTEREHAKSLDGGRGQKSKDESAPWSVATSSVSDESTLFIIESTESLQNASATKEMDIPITQSDSFVLIHQETGFILQLVPHGEVMAFRKPLVSKSSRKKLVMNTLPESEESKDIWDDYVDDSAVRPCVIDRNVALSGEVYKFEAVADLEVQSILFVSKFTSLFRAAVSTVQLSSRMDELYLPLMRHVNISIYTLTKWLSNSFDNEAALVTNPNARIEKESNSKSEIQEVAVRKQANPSQNSQNVLDEGKTKRYMPDRNKTSSMCPWIGRGCVDYSLSSITTPLSPQDATSTIPVANALRQDMLNDSRIIDILIYFTFIVYRLIHIETVKTKEHDSAQEGSKMVARQEFESIYHVPQILIQNCRLVQELLNLCVLKNRRSAVNVLAVNGSLVGLMDLEILGWKPPIETLMTALVYPDSRDNVVACRKRFFNPSSVLNNSEVKNLIQKMCDLYTARDESAINLLKLITTLCSPGQIPNITLQNLIFDSIFFCKEGIPMALAPSSGSEDGFSCLLLTTRFWHNTTWQLNLTAKQVMLDIDADDLHSLQEKLVQDEILYLKQIYKNSCTPNSNKLSNERFFLLFEQLGLSGHCLYEEISKISDTSFSNFVSWWYERRKIYFPSSNPLLNSAHAPVAGSLFDIISQLFPNGVKSKVPDYFELKSKYGDDKESLRFRIQRRVRGFDVGKRDERSFRRINNILTPGEILDNSHDMKQYSGLTVVLTRGFNETKKKLEKYGAETTTEWQTFKSVLESSKFESKWLHAAINLFSELCRGRNLLSQGFCCKMIPPELIIEVLGYGNDGDKEIMCRLLFNLYVEHDLVFATGAVTSSQAVVCSFGEDGYVSNITAGGLFNDMTRNFSTGVSKSSIDIREELWHFMKKEITALKFIVDPDRVSLSYQLALLQLLKRLLYHGFFNEADFFATKANAAAEELAADLKQNSFFSFSKSVETIAFNNAIAEDMLVQKVLETFESYKVDRDGLKEKVFELLLSQKEAGILSDDDFVGIRHRINSNNLRYSLGSENIGIVSAYFESIYKHASHMNVISEVISIIAMLFDTRQLSIVKKIANRLSNPSEFFSSKFLTGDVGRDATIEDIKYSKNEKQWLQSVFASDRNYTMKVTKCLWACSLYQSDEIKIAVYDLMCRQISDRIDAQSILNEIPFTQLPSMALLSRISVIFQRNIQKYFKALATYSSSPPEYIFKNMHFNFEALKSLCRNPLVDESLYSAEDKGSFSTLPLDVTSMLSDIASVLNIGIENTFVEEEKNTVELTLLNRDVMEKRVIDNIYALQYCIGNRMKGDMSLLVLTSQLSSILPQPSRESNYDIISPLVKEFIASLRPIIYASTDDEYEEHQGHIRILHWKDLNQNYKIYVSSVFSFLFAVCNGVERLVQEYLVDLLPVVLKYLWLADCSSELLSTIAPCTNDGLHLTDEFLDSLISKILTPIIGEERYSMAARVLSGILSNPFHDKEVLQRCFKSVNEHIFCNGAMRSFIYLDMIKPSKVDIQLHCHVLEIVKSAIKMNELKFYKDLFQTVIPSSYCNRVLTNNIPLQIKSIIFELSAKLYTLEEVPLNEFVIADLNTIIKVAETNDASCAYFSMVAFDITKYVTCIVEWLVSITRKCKQMPPPHELNNTFVGKIMDRVYPYKALRTSDPIENIGQLSVINFFHCLRRLYGVFRIKSLKFLLIDFIRDKNKSADLIYLFSSAYSLHQIMYDDPATITDDDKHLAKQLKEMIKIISIYVKEYDEEINVQFFLKTDGVNLYKQKVSQKLLPAQKSDREKYSDLELFQESMDYLPHMPVKVFQRTAMMTFLTSILNEATEFLEKGGLQLIQMKGNIKETPFLKELNDFDKWLYGGGRFFKELTQFLSTKSVPGPVSSIFFHALCKLLDNSIEDIRSKNIPLHSRKALVEEEVRRIQRLQDAIGEFGVGNLVLNIVGRSCNIPITDKFVSELVPQALKLGFKLLASGNDSVQNFFMTSYSEATKLVDGNKRKFFTEGLRSILRKAIDAISLYAKVKGYGTAIFPFDILRALCKIYAFCGSLCSGHNDTARIFLRDQLKAPIQHNIVADVANSVNALLTLLCDEMHYITYSEFYEFLGPYVWQSNSDAKRKLIAWHDSRTDYAFATQIMQTIKTGFDCLTEMTQGPCLENQASVLPSVTLCPVLLEYLGCIKLNTTTTIHGMMFGEREILWDCSNPSKFYNTYEKELQRIGRLAEAGAQREVVMAWKKEWEQNTGSFKNISETYNVMGISMSIFQYVGRKLERSCVRLLLALLESTSPLVTEHLCPLMDSGIMLQNMENVYKLSFTSSGKTREELSDTAVAYLTLISTLSSAQRDDPTVKLDDLLLEWKDENAKKGFKTESLLASVEISTPEGSVQRVYFPIPKFVRRYWKYSEVYKAKELMLYAVSRESAEDKLSDFFDKSKSLIAVMRRQEKLKVLLTPFLHALFGGHSIFTAITPTFIKVRPVLFYLNFTFCFLYSYLSYRTAHPWIVSSEQYFSLAYDWSKWDVSVLMCQYAHFGLCFLLLMRELLNSPAADALEDVVIPGMNYFPPLRLLSAIISSVRSLAYILLSVWWPLMILGFSFLAYWYSPLWYTPVLLDLIPQIRLMSFLVEAVSRNVMRICYTLLLAILLLYVFAVLQFVFYRDQYALGGQFDCGDIISCFILHIDYGLTNPPEWINSGFIDPDIGEYEDAFFGYMGSVVAGTFINFVYIILINLVLQAIISGLIIDTFGEMRQQNEDIEQDIYDKCFICDISRDEFEQAEIPFKEHVTSEHNMWHYLWFMLYLDSIDPLSFTGPEYYASQFIVDKNSFVRLGPIKKSLSIERKSGQKQKEEISLHGVFDYILKLGQAQSVAHAQVKSLQERQQEFKSMTDDQFLNLKKMIMTMVAPQFSVKDGDDELDLNMAIEVENDEDDMSL